MKINEILGEGKTGPGLWANIHNKRKRGEKMRKKGEEGAPTEKALKAAQGKKNESVAEDKDPCWDTHKQVGMKTKDGKKVPNCVPKEGVAEDSTDNDESPYHTRILDRQTLEVIADDGPYDWENDAVDRAEAYWVQARRQGQSIVAQVYQPAYGKNYVTWQVPDQGEYNLEDQSVAEGKEDKIAQLKKDHATAVHWSKTETSPQKREAARKKAEKIKRHLDTQYNQGVTEGRVDQMAPGGADYSKHSTDELKAMLRPGVMGRNELKFKTLIRRELRKREQQGVAEDFGGGGYPNTPKYKVGDSVMVKGYQGVGKIAYIKHRNDVGVIIKEPAQLRIVTTIDDLMPKQGVAEGSVDHRALGKHHEEMTDQELRKVGSKLPDSWDAARFRRKLASHPKYAQALKHYDKSEYHFGKAAKQGVAEGLSKRDQQDVAAIKSAIERLQSQLSHPNADKAAIQQSIAHEKKRLALYGQGVTEGSLNESDKFTSWYDWKDQAESSGYTITKKDDKIVALNKQGQVVGHWSNVGKFLSGKAPRPNFKRPVEQGIAGKDSPLEETYHDDEFFEAYGVMEYNDEMINEAEYQGRKVTLNKPFRTSGGPKKFSVYVKNEKGNVVKVNFGDPKSKIKKHIPGRRANFRARHNCDSPGPKTSARYWSCRNW